MVQDLPFVLTLKKFHIEHYSTGMPKLFASDVTVKDKTTGAQFDATIKVNEPLIYKGIAVYQSSFEDGGSAIKLIAYPMTGARDYSFKLNGEIGSSNQLSNEAHDAGKQLTAEWTALRTMNVENMGSDNRAKENNTDLSGKDLRAVNPGAEQNKTEPSTPLMNESMLGKIQQRLGSAAQKPGSKVLKNVGPSVQYKLRDAAGQAREYHNYMLPLTLDGARVFLLGVRDNPNDNFSYLRLPADDKDSLAEFMRLRAAFI